MSHFDQLTYFIIHQTDNHWLLIKLVSKDGVPQELIYIDSRIDSAGYRKTAKTIITNTLKYIRKRYSTIGTDQAAAPSLGDIKVTIMDSQNTPTDPQCCPRKIGFIDCGVFCAENLRRMLFGLPLNYSRSDIVLIRRTMMADMITGEVVFPVSLPSP